MKLNLEQAKSVVRKLNKAIAMMETQPEHRNKVIAMSMSVETTTASSDTRMVAIAGFENWSKERQDAYIKRHPGSKRSKNGGAAKPVKSTSDEQARKDRLLQSQKSSKKKDSKPVKDEKPATPVVKDNAKDIKRLKDELNSLKNKGDEDCRKYDAEIKKYEKIRADFRSKKSGVDYKAMSKAVEKQEEARDNKKNCRKEYAAKKEEIMKKISSLEGK